MAGTQELGSRWEKSKVGGGQTMFVCRPARHASAHAPQHSSNAALCACRRHMHAHPRLPHLPPPISAMHRLPCSFRCSAS
jgi:hypothetical protein